MRNILISHLPVLLDCKTFMPCEKPYCLRHCFHRRPVFFVQLNFHNDTVAIRHRYPKFDKARNANKESPHNINKSSDANHLSWRFVPIMN
jgi:hypothetical protein